MNAGWPAYSGDRPKSANFTGSSGAGSGGGGGVGNAGLMASLTGGGRPSSSQQVMGSNTNWGAQQQQQQQQTMLQQQQLQQQQAAAAAQAGGLSNANTLSYGSLKNRFLSGASKNTAAPATTTTSGATTAALAASQAPNSFRSHAREQWVGVEGIELCERNGTMVIILSETKQHLNRQLPFGLKLFVYHF